MLIIKIKTKDEIRRISLEQPPKFAELITILHQMFNGSSCFTIKYLDDENDLVTVTNDRELEEAIHCVAVLRQPPILRLFLEKSLNSYNEQDWNNMVNEELNSSMASAPLTKVQSHTTHDSELSKVETVIGSVCIAAPKVEVESQPKTVEEATSPTPTQPENQTEQQELKILEKKLLPANSGENVNDNINKNNVNNNNNNSNVNNNSNSSVNNNNSTTPSNPYTATPKQQEPDWVEFKTRTNRTVYIDMSADACHQFGVSPYDRVETFSGPGTILGVDRSGNLWFQLDCDTGVSFWDDIKDFDTMVCKGIVPIGDSQQKSPSTPVANNKNESVNSKPTEPQLKSSEDMLEKAVLESIKDASLDEYQREIQQFYVIQQNNKNNVNNNNSKDAVYDEDDDLLEVKDCDE